MTEVKRVITLDRRLSKQEKKCLYWAFKGKSIKETAKLMRIKLPTVKEYRAKTIIKLGAKNISHAAILGIKLDSCR